MDHNSVTRGGFWCIILGVVYIHFEEKGEKMEYLIQEDNGFVLLSPKGDIKTTVAGEFEKKLLSGLEKTGRLKVDLAEVGYISSSGLRALLAAQQAADETDDGELILVNVGTDIMNVFKSTGFHNVLTIR